MRAEVFLDTNVLLYACSRATEDAAKKGQAKDLIVNTSFGLSSQVIQEFIANAIRNKALGLSEANIDATLEMATHVPVCAIDLELILRATTIRRTHRISHWDSTIVAAAQSLGCTTLYSEDLSHGQRFDGVQIINPFQ